MQLTLYLPGGSLKDFNRALSSSIGSANPVIHNAIMYNQWNNYDGTAKYKKKPLFYHGIDKIGATLMSNLMYVFACTFLYFFCVN